MKPTIVTLISLSILSLSALTFAAPATNPASTPTQQKIPLTITGGHDTNPIDHGRPVILIAAALGVPDETFRKAFSNVHPAPAGQSPAADDVRRNKQVLMAALSPHGITNDRLDQVSNYYRYRPESGTLWKNSPAAATATLSNGTITEITITNPGSGYSSPPTISLPNMPSLKLAATLTFSTDLAKNGSIKEIKISK